VRGEKASPATIPSFGMSELPFRKIILLAPLSIGEGLGGEALLPPLGDRGGCYVILLTQSHTKYVTFKLALTITMIRIIEAVCLYQLSDIHDANELSYEI